MGIRADNLQNKKSTNELLAEKVKNLRRTVCRKKYEISNNRSGDEPKNVDREMKKKCDIFSNFLPYNSLGPVLLRFDGIDLSVDRSFKFMVSRMAE